MNFPLLKPLSTETQSKIYIFLIFFILPYLFFSIGINIFQVAIAPGDGTIQGIPTKIFTSKFEMWNPYIMTGTFPIKDIGWQALYLPGMLVMAILPSVFGYNFLLFAHYTIAGFFTFLFLEKLGLRRPAALIGGLSFMFCGFLTAHKGHHTMMMAASYLPLIFYFFQRFVNNKKDRNLVFAGLMFGMSILADYTAVPMYIGMILLPYIVCTFLFDRDFDAAVQYNSGGFFRKLFSKSVLIAKSSFLIFGIGLFVAAVQLIPILESLKYVTRESVTYEFFTSYSFNFRLLPLLIFPHFYGPHVPFLNIPTSYVGPGNLSELSGYMGILPLLFAALAVIVFWKKTWRVVFWGAVAFFAMLLVLGDSTPFYRIMYHVPIYNMFRVPARNWLEVNFAVAVLCGYFIHFMITSAPAEIKKLLIIIPALAASLWVVVILILIYGYRVGATTQIDQALYKNSRLSSPSIYISLLIIFVSTILFLLLYALRKSRGVWLAAGVLIFMDLFSFGYFHDASFPVFEVLQNKPNPVVTYINQENPDRDSFRIFPFMPYRVSYEKTIYPLTNILFDLNATNGYGAIWLKDFENLTKFEANGVPRSRGSLLRNSSIVSILSTKYLVVSNPDDKRLIDTIWVGDPGKQFEQVLINGYDPKKGSSVSVESRGGSLVLHGNEAGDVSLIQIPISIEPNTTYKVSFVGRIPEDKPADGTLVVDLYGKNYDSQTQESYFETSDITGEFQSYNTYFNSGPSTPQTGFLRFFTFSDCSFEIRNIVLSKASQYVNYWGEGKIKLPSPLYALRYESPDGIAVYENLNFLPRARFVENIRPVESAAEAIHILWNDNGFIPAQTALVENYVGEVHLNDGRVLRSDYSRNDLVNLTVETSGRSFLVLSDMYYVGWKAFVDGKETPIYKTNATSRGIVVPSAGEHLIKFQFIPVSFYAGLAVSVLTLLIAGFIIVKKQK